jgi:translation elongation factor EF-1alpha
MDKSREQQMRGVSINFHNITIERGERVYNFIDSPGHRDFQKNTIRAASMADYAVIVIAGSRGEFEAGISDMG